MPTVVLAGTLDTKGHEYAFVRDRLREHGVDVLLVDVGVYAPQVEPDVSREEVARAAGEDAQALADAGDRGEATEAMGRGAAALLLALHEQGRLDGVLGLGGSGGSSIVTAAMRALPVGVPKLMVSTLASGDTRPYVGAVRRHDDVFGRRHRRDQLGLGAHPGQRRRRHGRHGRRDRCRRHLRRTGPLVGGDDVRRHHAVRDAGRASGSKRAGYEVLVFHATGTGGRTMEGLVGDGLLAGVLDITTTELADELVGGVLSAGPDRLEAAGRCRRTAGGLARRARHGELRRRATRCRSGSRDATSTRTTRPSR